MAETLQDRLRKEADRGTEKGDGRDCCYTPWTCCDPDLLREAASKLDELESRPRAASVSEEPDISDRWLWNEALDLHRGSEGGSANGLHIYFALQRVRKSALAAASTGGESAEDSQDLSGWIMGDSEGRRWRGWGNYGPTWQTDPMKAIRFAHRKDAEAVFAEDEDAWTVIELAAAIRSQKDGE